MEAESHGQLNTAPGMPGRSGGKKEGREKGKEVPLTKKAITQSILGLLGPI